MTPYLLADDLSGALEAGAAFLSHGVRVTLAFGASDQAASVGLRVLSSETRNTGPTEAAATVARVLADQRAAGSRLLFKKIDSTLRGPVGAELGALIDTLAPPLVVVCPANPVVGRTVRDGRLLVHRVPVAETEFRNDPGWPVKESSVEAVLAAAGVGGIVPLSLARLRSLDALGTAYSRGTLVCDAESQDDLTRLVRLVRESEPSAVFVGSGGLAHAVASGSGSPETVKWTAPRDLLIVSGSLSWKSRRQLEVLRDSYGVPLHEIGPLRDENQATVTKIACSLRERGVASLTVRQDFQSPDAAAPVNRLTEVVKLLVATGCEPEVLAATGGETARSLCAALGIDGLELVGEVEPGVVVTRIMGHPMQRLRGMVIKPGAFGSSEVWVTIIPGIGGNQ